jgi:transposase
MDIIAAYREVGT